MRKHTTPSLAVLVVFLGSAAHAALVTSVFDGRVPCVPAVGVGQVCSSAGVVNRVETWDGVPLDVTVTLPPPEQNGPFPLIVDLHGFGAGKTPDPEIEALAMQGYAILIYSARGIHFSCGFAAARLADPTIADPDACADRGWIRLADARYEGRDTQYLAGRLVDEGLVIPDKIGVTGVSYGGGQSLILAALKNRTMMLDGSLVPWQSPNGIPMTLAAAAPIIGWSDLAYALVPSGRTLDYRALNPYFIPSVSERAGVLKQSWVDALYEVGVATGFFAPDGVDPDADITVWKSHLDAGEPYDSNPVLRDAIEEITSHHSAYYIDDSIAPAPLVIYNAWTDDIMPVDEALRFYRKTKSLYPAAEISLQFADHFAHMRGLLANPLRPYAAVTQLFARHLKGTGGPLPGVLETYTQACPPALEEGPFSAADWDALHPGEVRHIDAAMKTFDSAGGNALNATLTDPVAGGATACRTAPSSTDDPGAVTYRVPVTCAGYTLMGSPTVIADVLVSGEFPQIAARLWDVAPDTTQTLVAHALYRPRLDDLGPQVFQLHPSGWRFAAGHVVKLELLGQSAPYGRPSNGTFAVTVSNLELRLPTREVPDGCVIQPPAAPVFPPNAPEVPGTTTTILGKRFQVKNPGGADQRAVVGQARERFSPDAIVGDPVANGASLRVIANGGTDSDQTFSLSAAGWRRQGTSAFQYTNRIPGGAVKKASIKKAPNGTFTIKVLVHGRYGPVNVVPPNPGVDGGFILTLTGGKTYCVGFGSAGGIETKDTATQWSIRSPSAEVCPGS